MRFGIGRDPVITLERAEVPRLGHSARSVLLQNFRLDLPVMAVPSTNVDLSQLFFPALNLLVLVILGFYSLNRISLVRRFWRYRCRGTGPTQRYAEADLPKVTVQLPIYNEINVVERLLEAVARIDYPRQKLEIQVLDDSTDRTQEICRQVVGCLQERGLQVRYIHRENREGFKAGALENGLKVADGELIAIFDADFVPPPQVLRETVDRFTDPMVAMVQARWSHLNRDTSLLTRIQALMLDSHFTVEQTARNRSDCFFNFNGTAGVWRVEAIAAAGGWQHDTLTEDLDLSYRVQLGGWKCIYLPEIHVPAEIPQGINAFKGQQFRWTKGSVQTMKKHLMTVLSSDEPLGVKCESFFHLTGNVAYPLLLAIALIALPNQLLLRDARWDSGTFVHLFLFFCTTVSISLFYVASQIELRDERGRGVLESLHEVPLLLCLGIGISLNQSIAFFEGLLGRQTAFVRTPKYGAGGGEAALVGERYRARKRQLLPYLELFMAFYAVGTAAIASFHGNYLSLPFLLMFAVGFAYVGLVSLFSPD